MDWLVLFCNKHIGKRQLIILLSFVVGIVTAIAAYILKWLIEEIRYLLTNSFDVAHMQWMYLLYPAIGILITALFIKYIVRDDIGHGVTKILFAISRRQGHIKRHNCWSSVIASSITIGCGGSVGAESPVVLTGSAIGSTLGKFFHVDQKTLMLLIGCGASGAIAGIFKAPVAGILFTLEVLMLDLTMASLLPLLVSCVTASVLTYSLTGFETMFTFSASNNFEVSHVLPIILLGISCGIISLYFTKAMNTFENLFSKVHSLFGKLAMGTIVLSILIFFFPPLYGEGYNSISTILDGNAADLLNNTMFYGNENMLVPVMGLIILTKVFATTATTGAGGCGGLFAPSLFLGCISGFVFASLWNNADMYVNVPVRNFALFGMAGIMTAIMHAPMTSIFLIAELTGGYEMLVPLMIVTISSYLSIIATEPHSIYSMRLAKKGQLITHHKDRAILTLMSLDSVIDKHCMKIDPDMLLGKLVLLIAKEKSNVFPVVDKLNDLKGLIFIDNIRNVLFRQELYRDFDASGLMERPLAILNINDPMTSVMDTFEHTTASVLPVQDENGKFIGLIYKSKLFGIYRQMLVDFSEE